MTRPTAAVSRLAPAFAVMISLPLLGGCTDGTDRQVADAPNDSCAVHRAVFRSNEPTFQDVAGRVALSAAGGALAGALVSTVAGPRAGIAVGAAVFAAGVTATLINANIQQMDAQRRRDALLSQTSAVNRYGERVTDGRLAIDRLQNCRRLQVRSIQADVRGGRMPRPEGEARLAEIRTWYEGDITLINSFDQRLQADTQRLQDSTRFINQAGVPQQASFSPFTGIVMVPTPSKQQASPTAPDGPQLESGQSLRVVAREGEWLRVQAPGGRPAFVRSSVVAREVRPTEQVGASAQQIRSAAADDSQDIGSVAAGSSYRVVARSAGWVVVDTGGRRGFVRAGALRPSQVDDSGSEVVQATSSAVATRNAFAEDRQQFAAELRRVSLDS